MSVPELGSFIINLDTKEQLGVINLSSQIQTAKEFFKLCYVDSSEENLYCTIDKLLTDGYSLNFKIFTIVDILHINTDSQTRKYKYEECMGFIISPSTYFNIINDVSVSRYNLELEQHENLIKNNRVQWSDEYNELICGYNNVICEKKKLLIKERISMINNFLNQLMLGLMKIDLIIKNIDI